MLFIKMEDEKIDDNIIKVLNQFNQINEYNSEQVKSILSEIENKNIINLTKKSFEIIYRNLGTEMRENKLTFSKFLCELTLLKLLYSKNTKKIILVCGINVLLPLFEFLYFEKNNETNNNENFTIAITLLKDILLIIFNDESNLSLGENDNFFQSLRLLIDNYNNDEIIILTDFIFYIIKQYKNINKYNNFLII